MSKYKIREPIRRKAQYRHSVSSAVMDIIQQQIMDIMVIHKVYRDKYYSAKKLAEEIGIEYEKKKVTKVFIKKEAEQ